jgi:putative YhdH/YhfP family quinone oxidoreductase
MKFRALRVRENSAGQFESDIESLDLEDLPAGELLIRVHYSALNYKDALSASGHKGITKNYPHTPGIDAAGVVEISRSDEFAVDEEVIVTGFDLGMNTDGGMAEYIRVPVSWAMKKPAAFSMKETMAIGTAGLTAAAAVHKMQLMGQAHEAGPIVVSGATGGVGSFSVAILASLGYEVIAVTGKTEADDYLRHLGASRIAQRSLINDTSSKFLIRPSWAGAIDTVGGNTLNTLLRGCRAEGSVVSTGLVDSPELKTTVYPFILNGVNLLGIGSAETPMEKRKSLWEKLEADYRVKDKIQAIAKEVPLEEVKVCMSSMLEGKIMGRIVVRLAPEGLT